MGSAFDNLQNNVFNTTLNAFGYAAEWTAKDGGATFSGKVHFKNPTEEQRLAGIAFDPYAWMMEYKMGDFAGLLERVEKSNTNEVVTIDGVPYYVIDVKTHFDGKTLRAALQPIDTDTDE